MSVTGRDLIETEKPEWLTQMETVLEVLNEGVLIADDRHRILFANSRLVEMTGIPRQDLIRLRMMFPLCWCTFGEMD